MRSVWLIVIQMVCAMLLCCCHEVVVEDDLYDIDKEQGRVTMKVFYLTYSPDKSDSIPSMYNVDVTKRTEFPTRFDLRDKNGLELGNTLLHTFDTLSYTGYAQPGFYRFRTIAPARGYRYDSLSLEVLPHGQFIERNPAPLYCGNWERQIEGGDVLDDTVVVRQRTREVVFRILMALGDSIRYVSSDVRLTHVNYHLDLTSDAIDPTYQTPLPLDMKLESFCATDGTIYPALVDTINILSPSARQYAEWELENTLSVRINFAYNVNGVQRSVQPVDCSFNQVLAPAYSEEYAVENQDPYCIKRYVWQAEDVVTFHTALDTIISGDIVPWEIVTAFGNM